jgi:hypothetical protein
MPWRLYYSFKSGLVIIAFARLLQSDLIESFSKIGFWFKIAAGPSLKPEAYCCMSRILNEAPTKILGQKTFLSWVLIKSRADKTVLLFF